MYSSIIKVLFLDIDGVLNTKWWYTQMDRNTPKDKYGYAFDPNAVANLKRILDETGAEIVISSSWKSFGLSELEDMWHERGLPGKLIDITPNSVSDEMLLNADLDHMELYSIRGMEIKEWLAKHDKQVSHYAVIDDMDNFLLKQKSHFVHIFAPMRKPSNVWMLVYVFDSQGNPVGNFCGYDDLDGFAKFIPSLKQLINVDNNISTSEWGCDPRLYGKWYSVQKSIHPVLNTIDYSLTVDFYNEDGTMLKHLQLGMKSPDFSPNIRWGKYVFEWKTKNNEILITNEDLRLKEKMKYDCENEVLTKNNVHYYRTLEDAINAINL